jgi:DNA-binding NarL/FixJ family response regulator
VPHYLIATDANWVLDEVRSALEETDTTLTVCRSGQQVGPSVKAAAPDLAILDLQIGNMGAMAVTMDLRLEESGGRLPHVPVLMLLDRTADIFLASRSGAEGWLLKPLDSLRLRRAVSTVLAGGNVFEGVPADQLPVVSTVGDTTLTEDEDEASEGARSGDGDVADSAEAENASGDEVTTG